MNTMVSVDPGVLSQAEFARRRGVSRVRVNQWIEEGKLDGNALVGEAPPFKVREAVAIEQLRTRLNIDQRLANGLDTNLKTTPAPAPQEPPSAAAAPAPPTIADQVEDQIKRARLAGIEYDNRKKAEDEAARSGRLTDAEGARAEMGKLAVQMMTVFDGALPELASALAAKFQVPQRDVLHLLRTEFRKVRENAASLAKQKSLEVPSLTEREIDDTGSA